MKAFTLIILLSFTLTFQAQKITIELFSNGFLNPVDIQNAGDGRLFIVEQNGRIRILNPDSSINATPFLDITSIVGSGGERGLLGLAFHPNYINNGFFFVNYTNNFGNTQISRFTVDSTNPNIANPTSEFQIISINQPFNNHNGGCIQFGSDNFLYIGMGDGGGSGDPNNSSQNLTQLLGKMLRIDIDSSENGNNYTIPADNPFAGDAIKRKEIWAYGLRNPWRFSFDNADNSLWIADVGQNQMEEVNKVNSNLAEINFGWRCYEANLAFDTSGCSPVASLTFPFIQYPLTGGNCAVTGGYVYRGNIYSDIQGLYFFADVCAKTISTVDFTGNIINHGNFGGSWVSFGLDINNEMYIADISGSIYKIKGDILLSTQEFENQSISIIPNPASEFLKIKTKNNIINTISIVDLKGSVLLTEENIFLSEKNIDISSLSKGIYLVRLKIENGTSIVKKLIVN